MRIVEENSPTLRNSRRDEIDEGEYVAAEEDLLHFGRLITEGHIEVGLPLKLQFLGLESFDGEVDDEVGLIDAARSFQLKFPQGTVRKNGATERIESYDPVESTGVTSER